MHERIAESWTVAFTCGNLFSKNNRTWEFIFEEKGLFEISENKNLSKITSYTVSNAQPLLVIITETSTDNDHNVNDSVEE